MMSGPTQDSDHLAEAPADYVGWGAETKLQWLWAEIIEATEYSAVERPDPTRASPATMLSVAGRRATLARTLDRAEDLMEPERPKIIHAEGAVAKVELEPIDYETSDGHDFTGVLARPPAGGACGLVRFSLAVPPEGKGSITPGIGLKLLVDGRPSLDLLAMNHTVGQGRDFNLFSNTFTHDLRQEHEALRRPQRIMAWFFKRVVSQPRRLTIDHFAAIDRRGTSAAAPRVPGRLVFRPHPDVKRVYAGAHGEDFRDPLLRIESGTALYVVEAVGAGPGGGDLAIATLRTASRFTCSAGGDRLFFRHHVHPDDRLIP